MAGLLYCELVLATCACVLNVMQPLYRYYTPTFFCEVDIQPFYGALFGATVSLAASVLGSLIIDKVNIWVASACKERCGSSSSEIISLHSAALWVYVYIAGGEEIAVFSVYSADVCQWTGSGSSAALGHRKWSSTIFRGGSHLPVLIWFHHRMVVSFEVVVKGEG